MSTTILRCVRGFGWVVVALASIGLSGRGIASASSIPLNSPTFTEGVSVTGGHGFVVGMNDLLPEDVNMDVTASGPPIPGQAVGRSLTSTFGPQLDLQVHASGGGAIGVTAQAFIHYQVMVERIVADAPVAPVRVRTHVLATAGVTGAGSGFIELSIPDPTPGDVTRTRELNYNIASNHSGTPHPNGYPRFVNISESYLLMFPVNTPLEVVKRGLISVTAGSEEFANMSSDGELVADPIFTIDPTFMVDYNGNQVSAASLYTFVYSPGIVPIPEPSAVLWLVPVLLMLRRRG